jgi:hypothetical protein
VSACVYHAAPMTQKPEADQEIPNLSSLPALEIASPELRSDAMTPVTSAVKVASAAAFTKSSVFFGPTSFSAVFHENQDDLGPALRLRSDVQHTQEMPQGPSGLGMGALEAHFVRLGTKVFSRLPNQQTCNLMLKRHFEIIEGDGWFKPATQMCADMLWSTYRRHIGGQKCTADFETVSRVLCQNARAPLDKPEDPADPKEYISSFSGRNTRWESLGLILVSCCFGAISSADTEIFTYADGRERDKSQFVQETKECISICVTLCSHTDSVNHVMVALLYSNCLLLSVTGPNGDTSRFQIPLHTILLTPR